MDYTMDEYTERMKDLHNALTNVAVIAGDLTWSTTDPPGGAYAWLCQIEADAWKYVAQIEVLTESIDA